MCSPRLVNGMGVKKLGVFLAVLGVVFLVSSSAVEAKDPVKLGLVAALSGQSATSGQAITRGLTIALEELVRIKG